MKKQLLCLLIFICAQNSFSQKQANFWYFSLNAGLDFTSGSAVPITNGALNTTEGSSSISDASGNLLFYTDGVSVWDKTNTQMPNGFGLLGDVSTTQSALIVPDPGNASKYYIFTLTDETHSNGFRYSVVDMTLNSGKGDVTVKNSFLKNTTTEKQTAVYHCNGHDVWVMVHEVNTNQFAAFLVTNSGINPPVISNVGPIQFDVHGQMKFNTNGTKIACCRDTVIDANNATYKGNAFIDVFKFDNTTGVVSNPLILSLNNHQKTYGVEFSADNSKLYASYYDVTGATGGNSYIDQFDLTATNVQASQTNIGTSSDPAILRSLQLGPDGKIYVAKSNGPFVCVVNSPNVAGASCNYVDNAINVDPSSVGIMCMLGLPAFIQSYFNISFPNVPCTQAVSPAFQSSDTTICKGTCINFTDMSSGSPSSWKWTFQGALTASSTNQNPTNICYAAAGTYTVKLVVSNGSTKDSITSQIIVKAATVNAGPDIIITPGASAQLNATGSTSYTWSPATALSNTIIANPTASPTVTTTYVVTGAPNSCGNTDSVTVFVEVNCNEHIYVPTAFSPNGDAQNETECVMGNCITTLSFLIFDRWGEKVFETTDPKICWEGIFNGKQMDSGVFVYYLKATFTSGKEVSQKGNITLIR
jgi:gliding motility-associated-like protein